MTRTSSGAPGEAKAGAAEKAPVSARLPDAQRLLEQVRRRAHKALRLTVVFSLACHVAVFFLPKLLALWGLWSEASSIGLADMAGEVGFDVDLHYQEPAPPAAPPADVAPAATPAPTEAPKPPTPKPAPTPPPAASLATPRREGRGGEGGSKSAPDAQAKAGAGGAGGRSGGTVRDPLAAAGKAGGLVARDVNLQVLFVTENLRGHALANELGPALMAIPQWKTFFGPTSIDPIRDTDRILVAGPGFRDVSQISAAVKFRLSEAKLREAVDDLRRASDPPGEWVSESPPTAKVRAGSSDRYVVLNGGGLVATVPEAALEQAKRGLSFSASRPGEVFLASIRHPDRAFRGLPFTMPSSVVVVRVSATLRPDSSADLLIDATDKDASTAEASARTLTSGIAAMSVREVPLLGRIRLFDPVEFRAEGEHIKANAHINAAQTRELARLVAAMLGQGQRPREQAPPR